MSHELLSCHFDIIEAGLDPLQPVAIVEEVITWLTATSVCNELFEGIYTSLLKLGNIAPAVVYTSIIFRLVIISDLVFLLRDEEVRLERWYIMCVLHVVARIVLVVDVRLIDRLVNLLEPFIVGPSGLIQVVFLTIVLHQSWFSVVNELYHLIRIE